MMNQSYSLQEIMQTYFMCLRTAGRSERTIQGYEGDLKRLIKFLSERGINVASPGNIGLDDVRSFIAYLQKVNRYANRQDKKDRGRLSPFSVSHSVRSIKAFWSWLKYEEYIRENPLLKLKLPKVPNKIVNTFSPQQIQAMLKAINTERGLGYRNYAVILLLLDTGIRRQELLNLKIEDIDFGQSQVKVFGKGSRERIVPLGANVRRVLIRYIDHYRKDPWSNQKEGALFLDRTGAPMSCNALRHLIINITKAAGIENVRCSPHTFRHTFAKQYLMQGGDVFSLQRILGHSSLEIVKLYVNLAATDVAFQHRKFSPVDGLYLAKGRKRM